MITIRYPTVNGETDRERLLQLERYLRYLADTLNLALAGLERKEDNP